MLRKLIKLSPSTSVISLPSNWIKSNNLKKGTALSVEVNENKIIVSPQQTEIHKEIQIDISKFDGRLLWVAIDTAYTAGYDSIIIKTKDAEQSSYMTKVARYFPGMMIIDEHKTHVHFKSIDESPTDLNKIINRIFNLTVALLEDSIEAIKLKEWNTLIKIKYRDYVINSYVSYCFRSINKFGYSPFSQTGVIHSFLKIIEIFSDKLCVLFESIGKEKARSVKVNTLNLVLEMYNELRQVHFKYSIEKIITFDENRQKLLKNIEEMPSYAIPVLNDLVDLFFALEELEMQLNS